MAKRLSIVIPAKNEEQGLAKLLPELQAEMPEDVEIIVVNDGSTDSTSGLCQKYSVTEIKHPYSKGNGASVKSGARNACGDVIVFMDADGQHSPGDINRLVEKLNQGFDMVVGARSKESQASIGRRIANGIYNRFASYVTGHKVADLTSGFRAVRAEKFRQFLYIYPNGFSYPTTSTMAFFRAGYSVAYEPIVAQKRSGISHIQPVKDGVRFFLIIFKIGTLYSPLKVFFPMSAIMTLAGLVWYGYTFFAHGRFTNMSALSVTAGLMIFVMGLISEQITMLLYKDLD